MPTALDTSVWRTPTGTFTITSKVKDPTWFVPSSIQNKMKKEGKPVKTIVPPGKENPLGKYALKTSLTGILIHGTIFPESIYSFSSHGCIRVLPKSMEAIFAGIPINTRGEIIYQPVKLTKADNKYVFLEVHDDVYGQVKDLKTLTKRLVKQHQAEHLVDWEKINTLLARKTGTPEDITLSAPKQEMTGSCEQQQHTSAL
jgi:L,D-transpeptidase ErfK/SrfK